MSCTGTLSLSCYYFWNQNGELSGTWIACTPIISIVLVYVAYGLGLGSIPIMLQVRVLEPVRCKKQQKKVPDQLLVCGIGDL